MACICPRMTRVVRSLLRQRYGLPISPYLFGGRDTSLVLTTITAFQRCCSFIEQLRQKIFARSSDEKPECSVEKDGCGLMVWRQQRYQGPIQTVWPSRQQLFCIFIDDVWQMMIECWLNKTDCPNLSLLNLMSRRNTYTLDHSKMQRLFIVESKVSFLQFLLSFASNELYLSHFLFHLGIHHGRTVQRSLRATMVERLPTQDQFSLLQLKTRVIKLGVYIPFSERKGLANRKCLYVCPVRVKRTLPARTRTARWVDATWGNSIRGVRIWGQLLIINS